MQGQNREEPTRTLIPNMRSKCKKCKDKRKMQGQTNHKGLEGKSMVKKILILLASILVLSIKSLLTQIECSNFFWKVNLKHSKLSGLNI